MVQLALAVVVHEIAPTRLAFFALRADRMERVAPRR
jgi:hypothetical protein